MRAKRNAAKLIATGLFLLLTLAGVQWWVTREPTYSGKPLSHWLLSLRSDDIKVQEEARAVFRNLPKAEVSSLLKILQSSDSRIRRFVDRKHIRVGVAGRGSHELLPSGNLLRAMAATALGIVGSNESAVLTALRETATHPSAIIASHSQAALIRITGDPVAPFLSTFADPAKPIDAIKAASVLYALGTNHQTIASQLTNLVDRSSTSDRFELIEFLCANELEPAVVWPVVLRTLDNVNLGANANALNAAMIHLNASTLWLLLGCRRSSRHCRLLD